MPPLSIRLAITLILAAPLLASDGFHDPAFDKVPFAQWLAGSEQTPLKWSEHTLPVLLSVHQRLMTRLQVQLDGAEAAKRRGEGELIFYFQIADSQGRIFQDHVSYDLKKVEEGVKAQDMVCTESAFVLPGDYSVFMAIYDTATKEHSVKKAKLHIAPLKVDPLPDAWRDVPPVEFLEQSETPDHWFLPKETGKLYLPLTPRRPLRIDVLVNLTPSQESSRTYGVQDRNLSIILPFLKVISQMSAPGLALNVGLIDLSRRRVTFHQNDVHQLNWDKIKASLSDANSGSIDVKSLSDRQHNAAFLLSEIERRFAQPAQAVIVLSSPMVFDTGQDLPEAPVKPPSDRRLLYVRIRNPTVTVPVPDAGMGRHRGMGGMGGMDGMGGGFPGRSRFPVPESSTQPIQADQLEPLLKPLDPRLFDVLSAEQFRKALAAIMAELSGI